MSCEDPQAAGCFAGHLGTLELNLAAAAAENGAG